MIFISPRKLLTIVLIPNKYDARAVYSALVCYMLLSDEELYSVKRMIL